MVSCRAAQYTASLVRLRHGDPNPDGPGVRETRVPSAIDGSYAGREQLLPLGSYGVVQGGIAIPESGNLALVVWVMPTLVHGRRQTLLRAWEEGGGGYALELDPDGRPTFTTGDRRGRTSTVVLPERLAVPAWHCVVSCFDCSTGRASIAVRPAGRGAAGPSRAEAAGVAPSPGRASLVIAARLSAAGATDVFNGKLESPALFDRVPAERELERLDEGAWASDLEPRPIAVWDFARGVSGTRVVDIVGTHHGELVNQPGRAVTGHHWSGDTLDFRSAPEQYAAIHFHDDDLEDARWEPAFELTVPEDLPSGIHAFRLTAGDAVETLPFVVRPPRGVATAPTLVLAPTLTYRAYANEHESWFDPVRAAPRQGFEHRVSAEDLYAARERLLSLYDRHSDGSGTSYVSLLRPQTTIRPGLAMPISGVPHALAADLYLIDWLEERGTAYDVVADEDLHEEGIDLLRRHRVVVTGTHPEYWTERMLTALTRFVDAGGRLMYLGGNGFYWVASLDPDRRYVMEVRRGSSGTGPFHGEPGEGHHSATGEPGGLWRFRGRPPNALVGVGFAAMGHVGALPYERSDQLDPRAAFVFDGVAIDGAIGDTGLCLGAAAALEVDRLDHSLGSPQDAMVLASAVGFPPAYRAAAEDATTAGGLDPGALVRSDVVYLENAAGGAVFSAGSIGWCGALSADGYDGPVSRMTGNVLDRFTDPEAPQQPLESRAGVG
jgi:N,N-dimethylformamidase beta subunit-like, C-terminal/Concanavalin A-like lectin/glucanases superfamily